MTKSLIPLALLGMLTWGAVATPARADGPLDFKLENRLGVTISRVHISPHSANRWEEDVLGDDVLRTGGSVNIRFGGANVRRGNLWDLKIVTSDDRTFTWTDSGFNLAQTAKIAISLRGGKAVATAEGTVSAD